VFEKYPSLREDLSTENTNAGNNLFASLCWLLMISKASALFELS